AARRKVHWILNPPRRSFKQRVLIDRQRPMKNITLDGTAVLQLDADGADGALDAAADSDVLRNDAAFDPCAIADHEIRSAQLAFYSAEDLSWTIAFDFADDRHAGADARIRNRSRRPLRPGRGQFSDRTLRDFGYICSCALILLGYLVFETIQHAHLPSPP